MSASASRPPLTTPDGEVRPLDWDDIRHFRSAAEVLPPELLAVLPQRKPGQRGPQKAPVKQGVYLRLDVDVLERFKADGPGWQTRINQALRRAVL